MESLDVLQTELEGLGPQVEAADKKILAALEIHTEATLAYEKSKVTVRKLKAIRDPLRIEQMQLQSAVGNVDGSPPAQTISNGGE